jgi:predicted esterase
MKHSFQLSYSWIPLLLISLSTLTWAANKAQSQQNFMEDLALQEEFEIGGRKAFLYEHAKQDGTPVPFYLVPSDGTFKNPPLHVVLHHAGGSAKQAINEAFSAKHRHQYVAREHCALYLDCRSLKTDWWWGWKTIEKDKELHKQHLQSAEERVFQTIEWAVKKQKIDRNRIYLSGRSMGGSGSLGIGYVRGDIFAAILVNVPAGADHALFRLQNTNYPDPPPTINTSSQTDGWSRGQENLLAYCRDNKLPMVFGWGPFGHASRPSMVNSAVYDFPWRKIVRNEAYPVFTNAVSDDTYPGFKGKGEDQEGQINGYFRWKNIEDSKDRFSMELRLVKQDELGKPAKIPGQSHADVTLRRLQHFKTEEGKSYEWSMVRGGTRTQTGMQISGKGGILTVPKVEIGPASVLNVIRVK